MFQLYSKSLREVIVGIYPLQISNWETLVLGVYLARYDYILYYIFDFIAYHVSKWSVKDNLWYIGRGSNLVTFQILFLSKHLCILERIVMCTVVHTSVPMCWDYWPYGQLPKNCTLPSTMYNQPHQALENIVLPDIDAKYFINIDRVS